MIKFVSLFLGIFLFSNSQLAQAQSLGQTEELTMQEMEERLATNNVEVLDSVCQVALGCLLFFNPTPLGKGAGAVLMVKGGANLVNSLINRTKINNGKAPNAKSALGSAAKLFAEQTGLSTKQVRAIAINADNVDFFSTFLVGGVGWAAAIRAGAEGTALAGGILYLVNVGTGIKKSADTWDQARFYPARDNTLVATSPEPMFDSNQIKRE